eukprot:3273217-Rhodomonas_salina.1
MMLQGCVECMCLGKDVRCSQEPAIVGRCCTPRNSTTSSTTSTTRTSEITGDPTGPPRLTLSLS